MFHSFFKCPRYVTIRYVYLSDYLQIHNTYDLLYGKENVLDTDNETLFFGSPRLYNKV